MATRSRQTHSPAFKPQVAWAAIKGVKTLTGSAQQYDVSKPAPGHRIDPYLLRALAVERANPVPRQQRTMNQMGRGFAYRGRNTVSTKPASSASATFPSRGAQ